MVYLPTSYGYINAVSGRLCDSTGRNYILKPSPFQSSRNRIILTILNWEDVYDGVPGDYTWVAVLGTGYGASYQAVTITTPENSSSSESSDEQSFDPTHEFIFEYNAMPECNPHHIHLPNSK